MDPAPSTLPLLTQEKPYDHPWIFAYSLRSTLQLISERLRGIFFFHGRDLAFSPESTKALLPT